MKDQIIDALLNPDATQDWRGIVIVAALALPAVLYWMMHGTGKRRRHLSAVMRDDAAELPLPSDGGVSLWLRANMAPRSNPPNPQRDVEYFSLLYAAAAAGHPEAQLQLGRLSLSYRSFVECYFWLSLARARGMAGSETESLLAECREEWISAGCPTAKDSVSRNLDADQATIGHAMLDIESCRNAERGVFDLTEQEMRGNPAAIEIFRSLRNGVVRNTGVGAAKHESSTKKGDK